MLCYGCSEKESKYREGNTIKVCKSFAKKIWKVKNDEDLNKPSTRFDGCGLLASEENNFNEIEGAADLGYIIPSKVFNSFEEFINKLKIKYYEEYTIVVVDGDESTCFNGNNFLKISSIFLLFLGIINFA